VDANLTQENTCRGDVSQERKMSQLSRFIISWQSTLTDILFHCFLSRLLLALCIFFAKFSKLSELCWQCNF